MQVSMNDPETAYAPDAAGVFACAHSLWECCIHRARTADVNLSEAYAGMDQLMREILRIAAQFELWACRHVDFESFGEVWPFFMADHFGEACVTLLSTTGLSNFGEKDCLRVALRLRIPVKLRPPLRVPIDIMASNPIIGTRFCAFRIQTVRDSIRGDYTKAFTPDDDPFDPEFTEPWFSLYGLGEYGHVEHISDRATYHEILDLVTGLIPGIEFPPEPHSPMSGRRKGN